MLTMSPGHVVLKGGGVTRARPRARGGRNATGQATRGLWRIFYKYGRTSPGSSPAASTTTTSFTPSDPVVSSRPRGSRAFGANGRHREGNGPGGMARSAGAGRRNPNMLHDERAQPHRAPRRRHRPHDTADSHQGSPAAGTGHWDWAVCRGSRVGRDGGTAGCGWRVALAGSVPWRAGPAGVNRETDVMAWM